MDFRTTAGIGEHSKLNWKVLDWERRPWKMTCGHQECVESSQNTERATVLRRFRRQCAPWVGSVCLGVCVGGRMGSKGEVATTLGSSPSWLSRLFHMSIYEVSPCLRRAQGVPTPHGWQMSSFSVIDLSVKSHLGRIHRRDGPLRSFIRQQNLSFW